MLGRVQDAYRAVSNGGLLAGAALGGPLTSTVGLTAPSGSASPPSPPSSLSPGAPPAPGPMLLTAPALSVPSGKARRFPWKRPRPEGGINPTEIGGRTRFNGGA
jgi:hypothetical protein